jgi:hypothetical protein
VWNTVKEAYATWWRNLPDLVRACWVWMLLTAPLWAIWVIGWQEPYLSGRIQELRAGLPYDPAALVPNIAPLVGLIALPAFASVAVAWHRLLLRDEHPRTAAYLRLDYIVAAYIGVALAGHLVLQAPNFVTVAFRFSGAAQRDAVALVAAVEPFVSFAVMFILGRLSLVLPALALGRRDVTLRAAWNVGKGNTWRLFGAYALCFVPVFVLTNGTLTFLSHNDDHVAGTVALIAMSLLMLPVSMIGVGVLSLAYRYFFESSAQRPRTD